MRVLGNVADSVDGCVCPEECLPRLVAIEFASPAFTSGIMAMLVHLGPEVEVIGIDLDLLWLR